MRIGIFELLQDNIRQLQGKIRQLQDNIWTTAREFRQLHAKI